MSEGGEKIQKMDGGLCHEKGLRKLKLFWNTAPRGDDAACMSRYDTDYRESYHDTEQLRVVDGVGQIAAVGLS